MSNKRLFGLTSRAASMPDVTRKGWQRRKGVASSSTPEKNRRSRPLVVPPEDRNGTDRVLVEVSEPSNALDSTPGMKQSRRNSTSVVFCATDYESAANPEERQRKGQCPSCGQQLFILASNNRRWFGLKPSNRKKALTVAGLVNRGQCVKCSSGGLEQPLSEKTAHKPAVLTATCVAATLPSSLQQPPVDSSSCAMTIQSSLSTTSSMTAFYDGSHNAQGERHGKGTMRWANGDIYVGEFFRGSRQGTGTLNFADGSEYVGDWWNNYMHGQGTRRFINGDVYVGDYRKNHRDGSGRFYFSNGDLYYGNWKGDKMEGFGRYYYHSGQRFEGYFQAGRRNGKGKLQRTDGSLDLYRYENDVRVGAGVRWSADRTKAWQLDVTRGTLRTKKITVAEAVSLVYQIDGQSAACGYGEGATDEFGQMLALEDTMDELPPLPGRAA